MSGTFDRLQDAPDVVTFLNHVKSHLATDQPTLGLFLAEVGKWVEKQSVISEGIHNEDSSASILQIAFILRFKPKLLHDLNSLLWPNLRLECSTTVDEVKYLVLVGPTGARIISTFGLEVPFISKPAWRTFLEANPDKHQLTCISQLLQVILDDPATDSICARRAYRCLRELAEQSILPPSIFINDLTRGEGHAVQGGAFADIYKGEMRGTPVCLRVLRMFETEDRELLFKDFCSEVLVWRQLRHPNILPLFGASLDLFPSRFCFVAPWLHDGNIMTYLKQHPQHDRFTSICEIVEGIEYLHGLDPPVTHKDIKGANVLVGDNLGCCLADFGLSTIVESQGLGHVSPAFQGSLCWMAPELINPSLSENNPKAGDIYALACTIYEIYTGKAPFLDQKKREPAIMHSILQGERPPLPPPGAWTSEEEQLWWLVDLCWKQKPDDRPEMHLIKSTLRDIGTFKPKVTQVSPSPSPGPKDCTIYRGEIERWLRKEHQQEAQISSDTTGGGNMPSYADAQEALSDLLNNRLQMDDRATPWISEPTVRQSHYPDSFQPNSHQKSLRLSLSSQDTLSASNSQGLLTPNTPSIPLAYFDLQPSYESDSRAPSPYRNNAGTHIAATGTPHLPASLPALTQLRPSSARCLLTPPSTPSPSPLQNPYSRPTSDDSVKSPQVACVNAEGKAPNSNIHIYSPASLSLSPSRPPFLPAHLRQSRIKFGSRPLVSKSSINSQRASSSSFSHAPSPLSQHAQPVCVPRNANRPNVPDGPRGDLIPLVTEDQESSVSPSPSRRKPFNGLSFPSSS